MSGEDNRGQQFSGLIAAPHTPMRPDFSLDLEKIAAQAALLKRAGLAGAFVCGTTGEGPSLSVAERMAVAEAWCNAADEGFAIIVHVGHNSLPECRRLAAHARDIGAQAIAVCAPSFFRPRHVEELVEFCAGVASAAPEVAFYFYHIPEMTGVALPVRDFLQRAAQRIPTLAGVKFTHDDMKDYARCVRLLGGRFNMLFGRDEFLLAGLALGARGAVGSTFNYAAPLYQRIVAAFSAGDWDTARREQARAAELVEVLERYGGVPAGKAAIAMCGLDCGPPRPPLAALSAQQVAALRGELEAIGFFDYCLRAEEPAS